MILFIAFFSVFIDLWCFICIEVRFFYTMNIFTLLAFILDGLNRCMKVKWTSKNLLFLTYLVLISCDLVVFWWKILLIKLSLFLNLISFNYLNSWRGNSSILSMFLRYFFRNIIVIAHFYFITIDLWFDFLLLDLPLSNLYWCLLIVLLK